MIGFGFILYKGSCKERLFGSFHQLESFGFIQLNSLTQLIHLTGEKRISVMKESIPESRNTDVIQRTVHVQDSPSFYHNFLTAKAGLLA